MSLENNATHLIEEAKAILFSNGSDTRANAATELACHICTKTRNRSDQCFPSSLSDTSRLDLTDEVLDSIVCAKTTKRKRSQKDCKGNYNTTK